jgi:3-deoxy-D-manno-octulosonic-acid transferase
VLFGPRNEGSRDAALLAQRGGGMTVANQSDLSRRLKIWSTDERARREAGDFARALVRSGVGAADRSFELVNRLLR